MWRSIALFVLSLTPAPAAIVSDVRALVAHGDLAGAEKVVRDYRTRNGVTAELLEAQSWMARGALQAGRFDQAEAYASDTRKLSLARLKTAGLEKGKPLEIALGASIEVQAGVLAGRGDRSGAVAFLDRELKRWWNTPLRARIQKNLNLLSLAGRRAPPIEVSKWLGPRPVPLERLVGRPILLFFWAHWCGDCKNEVPVLATLMKQYGPKGLVLIGPTQHYGYAAGGEDAGPEGETTYIDRVRREFYSALGEMPVPLSEENFRKYGASTVPTLVLIDRGGIVRLYHPGEMPYAELEQAVGAVMDDHR